MNQATHNAILALRAQVFSEAASRDEFTQRLASATFHALLGALHRYPACCVTYFVASTLGGSAGVSVDGLDRVYCPRCKEAIDGR
jgi:hypothetical protein